MYDWLSKALHGPAEVVTANRRLARVLSNHYSESQIRSGARAWATPAIVSQQDWLTNHTEASTSIPNLPTRLNAHHSRVLWEQCLARNLGSPELQSGALVRQAQDAWARVCAYRVPLEALQESARSLDQRVFVRAARDYAATLDRNNWIDGPGLSALFSRIARTGSAGAPRRVTFAGFDRLTPADRELREALLTAGHEVFDADVPAMNAEQDCAAFEDSDAELRAAGAWARELLLHDPGQRLGIVVMQLERDAERAARLVREGLAPGWQSGGEDFERAVNVSYGRRLSQYPVVAIALLALDWLNRDIGTDEVSQLLRSTCVGRNETSQRAAAEINLRSLPAMSWNPETLGNTLRSRSWRPADFLARIEGLRQRRGQFSRRQAPSQWAVAFDEILAELNWPGELPLRSAEFQLVNRWRELLNEFARLELVVPTMTLGMALSRIRTLASETVFQPQSAESGVQLMGPLEAAGIEFDALRVAGLSSANWPPQGNPSPLISRQVQRSFELPDYDPADTLAYASRVLRRLAGSAHDVVFSYPRMDQDAEQIPSGLLRDLTKRIVEEPEDPGWYASVIAKCASPAPVATDPVPRVRKSESISGGTATIQRQFSDPFSAFAYGRLGIRPIPRLAWGIPANLRGRLIHSALADLYGGIESQEQLGNLERPDLEQRVAQAARNAVAWLQNMADPVVSQLLALEIERVKRLLLAVIELDLSRPAFDIVGLEAPLTLSHDDIHMNLRVDRLERDSAGLVILDYKTGVSRKFIGTDGEPDDMQLVAYACAIDEPVSGLALVNVDSRSVDISGAGLSLTPELDWEVSLDRWRTAVNSALDRLGEGDIRVNSALTARERRQFALLSRIEELSHGG